MTNKKLRNLRNFVKLMIPVQEFLSKDFIDLSRLRNYSVVASNVPRH